MTYHWLQDFVTAAGKNDLRLKSAEQELHTKEIFLISFTLQILLCSCTSNNSHWKGIAFY